MSSKPTAPTRTSDPGVVAIVIRQLSERFGSRLSTGASVREQHGRGESLDPGMPPDAVVWPESTEEICEIVRTCAAAGVPIIPFGAGTSLEGHVSAPLGGICVDLSRMNKILAVNAEDMDCVVQPGVTREDLNAYLRETGLYFPVDPGANASIGGMVSTRASGTTTVMYGAMTHNVLALEAVLPDGRVMRCGTRARKSSAGYDLVRLLTGAEGTLGIISQITLRLRGYPEEIGAATCAFSTLRGAVDTVTQLLQFGAPMARMEFLDEVQIRACNTYSQLALDELPTLFLEFHGTVASVAEQAERAQQVAADNGGRTFSWATRQEDRTQLWKARHSAYFAALALKPGCVSVVADVCVPISALAEAVETARADIDSEGLLAPIVGHVGDGNFHVIFLLDPADGAGRERMDRVYDSMVTRANAVGGTCTGEHGIGMGKREKLVDEFGPEVVELMRAVKKAWDPNGIMNPGKLFL